MPGFGIPRATIGRGNIWRGKNFHRADPQITPTKDIYDRVEDRAIVPTDAWGSEIYPNVP